MNILVQGYTIICANTNNPRLIEQNIAFHDNSNRPKVVIDIDANMPSLEGDVSDLEVDLSNLEIYNPNNCF